MNFEIASVTKLIPTAAGVFSKDAFTDNKNADGITWGLAHFTNVAHDSQKDYSKLGRFDCDLSQKINDPSMKQSNLMDANELYFKQGLSKAQKERILNDNKLFLKK
ncbi:hypothetical protein [Flavobacterium ovatum]|uniref:hypothetical protein n=1 Tax=Flavobacterium ovatum TaxID=1928857 RepID=UPI0034506E60